MKKYTNIFFIYLLLKLKCKYLFNKYFTRLKKYLQFFKMNSNMEHCCICFKVFFIESSKKTILSTIKEVLKFLIVKVNSTLFEESTICETCLAKIQSAYKFKTLYLDGLRRTLTDVAVKEKTDLEKCIRCEICKNVNQSDGIPLFDSGTESGFNLIKYLSAELESKIQDNSLTCETCHKSLIHFYEITNLLSAFNQNHAVSINESYIETNEQNIQRIRNDLNCISSNGSFKDHFKVEIDSLLVDLKKEEDLENSHEEFVVKSEEVDLKIESDDYSQLVKRRNDNGPTETTSLLHCTNFSAYQQDNDMIIDDDSQTESSEWERKIKYCEKKKKDPKNRHKNEEDILRKREWEKERKRKYREKKKKELKDLDKNEENIMRKRELARERSRKYRQKKRLEKLNSNVIHDSRIVGLSQLPDNTRLSNTINNSQLPKDLTEDEETLRERELARERSRKYREKKRLEKLSSKIIHHSRIPEPSKTSCSPIRKNNSSEPICNFPFTESTITHQNEQNDLVLSTKNVDSRELLDEICFAVSHSVINQTGTYSSYKRHSSAHREFHKQFISNTFGHACTICDRLWFRNDLKTFANDNSNDNFNMELIRQIIPNPNVQQIKMCTTCLNSIQKNKIPTMSIYNGFKYHVTPDFSKNYPLDLVSERFVSPRIPFVQIRRLRHVQGQFGIYGQVINVPVEVDTMVNTLPRNTDDEHCIYVNIERKRIHKSSFVQGLIKKRIIKEWLKYLVNTPLYKEYGISINGQFFDDDQPSESENTDNLFEEISIEESLIAQQHTLIWNDDTYLRIAPGEKNVPVSLFDEHAEELSFPSIYYGQFRTFRQDVTVTPFMMATSELRRSDRRGVTPHHLLYMAMKIMRIRVRDSLSTAFKHIGKDTKKNIQSEEYLHGCIENNLAFLKTIPNSTWYWFERKKDLFAMIRQFGKPTVFFTISSNEIGWTDLLKLLYKLKNNKEISDETLAQMHYIQKTTLINEDAVTCTIYFNKLVNVIMTILQSKKWSPLKQFRIRHYFKRIEFQHSGSLRAHILAWLDNAPEDAIHDGYDKAVDLIDSLISVSESEASGNIQLQTHKHAFTCYKKITSKKAQHCRFEAPFMPCNKTMILTPMKNTEERFNDYRNHYVQIRKNLESEEYQDMNDFYNRNDVCDDEEYINILRAGIVKPMVFVKRQPNEKWHNPFNPFLLHVVKSNTDFQFITEEYSCAAYLLEFINKTNRRVSNLQRKIIEVMDEHLEFNIVELTRNVSVKLLNHTEITSQEAAWYLLREPMSKTSVDVVYIPTEWPVERLRIKKTIKQIGELEDDCTDIWKDNWFDKYIKRPETLEDITLAQFVSKYTINNKGEYVERKDQIVIRYKNYDPSNDFNEYKREMVTLHIPFRNEEEEILAEMKFISKYDDYVDLILQRKREFESYMNIEKTIQKIYRELCHEETPCDDDET